MPLQNEKISLLPASDARTQDLSSLTVSSVCGNVVVSFEHGPLSQFRLTLHWNDGVSSMTILDLALDDGLDDIAVTILSV